jgi:hypothetical protein
MDNAGAKYLILFRRGPFESWKEVGRADSLAEAVRLVSGPGDYWLAAGEVTRGRKKRARKPARGAKKTAVSPGEERSGPSVPRDSAQKRPPGGPSQPALPGVCW